MARTAKKENLKISKKKPKKKYKEIAGLLDGTLNQKILRLEQLITQPNVSPGAIRSLQNSIRAEKGQKLL